MTQSVLDVYVDYLSQLMFEIVEILKNLPLPKERRKKYALTQSVF